MTPESMAELRRIIAKYQAGEVLQHRHVDRLVRYSEMATAEIDRLHGWLLWQQLTPCNRLESIDGATRVLRGEAAPS